MKKLLLAMAMVTVLAVSAPVHAQEVVKETTAERNKIIDMNIQRHKEMISYLEKVKKHCNGGDDKEACKKIKEEMKKSHSGYKERIKQARSDLQDKKKVVKEEKKKKKESR